jgi:hypothetical protein
MNSPKIIDYEIDEPVLFNCWKHHAGFIKSKISCFRNNSEPDLKRLRNELSLIGTSLMDLYTGKLTPKEISDSIIKFVLKKKLVARINFNYWLHQEGKEYKVIELKDKSRWTLRIGEKQGRYIHIHPSRYSPYSIRIRAVSLKTTILFLALHNKEFETLTNLQLLNKIRKNFLDQPSIKSVQSASAIKKLIAILS